MSDNSQAKTYLVTIPPNVYPGMKFTVSVANQTFTVVCPPGGAPLQNIRIAPKQANETTSKRHCFQVKVPEGVQEGNNFLARAGGELVILKCLPNMSPGKPVRFFLDTPAQPHIDQRRSVPTVNRWQRAIRANNFEFQWVYLDDNGEFVERHVPDFESAYVAKLTAGRTLELVPANETTFESKCMKNKEELFSYPDISAMKGRSLDERITWFYDKRKTLYDGVVAINIRRERLLEDSLDTMEDIKKDQIRKIWKFFFIGEPGIDIETSPSIEWYRLVLQQLFHPDFGLWVRCASNPACMDINPSSGRIHPDKHLDYFRLLGRIFGHILVEGRMIELRLPRYLYNYLLGWPVTFDDLRSKDEALYEYLKQLNDDEESEEFSKGPLNFTVESDVPDSSQRIELIEGGGEMEVTSENKSQYIEARFQYCMMNRIKPQLTEFLAGFDDVIPKPMLSMFSPSELDILFGGTPEIDVDDWQANTFYSGLLLEEGCRHQVARWFWEIVREDLDSEQKAKLLQFAMGATAAPKGGFAALGNDVGGTHKFTICGVDHHDEPRLKSPVCCNTVDLPTFSSKEDLREEICAAIEQ